MTFVFCLIIGALLGVLASRVYLSGTAICSYASFSQASEALLRRLLLTMVFPGILVLSELSENRFIIPAAYFGKGFFAAYLLHVAAYHGLRSLYWSVLIRTVLPLPVYLYLSARIWRAVGERFGSAPGRLLRLLLPALVAGILPELLLILL